MLRRNLRYLIENLPPETRFESSQTEIVTAGFRLPRKDMPSGTARHLPWKGRTIRCCEEIYAILLRICHRKRDSNHRKLRLPRQALACLAMTCYPVLRATSLGKGGLLNRIAYLETC